MCACEPAFVCSRCRDTPDDPGYERWERPEPLYAGAPQMFGEDE